MNNLRLDPHLRELAKYCGVSLVRAAWWQCTAVPRSHQDRVKRFERMHRALHRACGETQSRALLRLAARAAEERRLIGSWATAPRRPARYAVVLREDAAV